MIIKDLYEKELIHPPKFILSNTHYLTIMGSMAYGVSSDNSDKDIYGFCIPNKNLIFPHLAGHIEGFGKQIERFNQWQEHHVKDPSANGGKGIEYDFSIYSIVKFFDLCMQNNPNMVDSLFTPSRCVIHSTAIGNKVRENRKIFLHKGCYHKFRGYAFSQLKKAKSINRTGKRKESVEKYGYDPKFLYHVIRLMRECEMIMTEGDLDLERSREELKAVRRGEISYERVEELFEMKEKSLEELYHTSDLPYNPDEEKIKELLLECLEMHFGKLESSAVTIPDLSSKKLEEIRKILEN